MVILEKPSFDFNRADNPGATDFYVWLSHDGRAEVTEIDTIADVDGALGETHFNMETPAAAQFYVWLSHDGRSETMSLDFTGITGATLPTGAVAAAYYDIDSTTAIYRFWFSDGSTTVPAAGGRVLIPVVFSGVDSTAVLVTAITAALVVGSADADFAAFGGTPIITGTLASVGNVTDPVDGAVTTGATLMSTTQGLAVAETDPSAEGTGLEATYTVGDSSILIKDALISAIDANGSWGAVSDSEHVLLMTSASVGVSTDTFDSDTGFGFSTTEQGVDAAETDPGSGRYWSRSLVHCRRYRSNYW